MKKTAIVYDKWLSTLGGGEVVACNFAKTLIDEGYQTIFACGKKVDPKLIKEKLGIDLSKAEFVEVWNDEIKLKELSKDKDVFVNTSFMDYCTGLAKKNFYYTSFPTGSSSNIKKIISSKILFPLLGRYIKPIEFIIEPKFSKTENKNSLYLIGKETRLAFSLLKINKKYNLKFFVYLPNFSKSNLDSINFKIENCNIQKQNILVNHYSNKIEFTVTIKPKSSTIYLSISDLNFQNNEAYLISPNISTSSLIDKVTKPFYQKFNSYLRAGIFTNPEARMKKYDIVFANSEYTKYWISKYWQKESVVLYPPVDLIFKNNQINFDQKKNYICSVGRFFTKGHGKKQEIMIEAFKKMCDLGCKNWELHLAGGIGNEPTSLEYIEKIKDLTKGYPIIFHFNVSRQEIVNLYLSSKIYWHAAGFGEDKTKYPIKFEHFGITPIEAMSAGCIPVLYNGGGLPETTKIMGLDPSIHLFNSIDELVINTQNLIKNKTKLDFESIFKIIDSNFSKESFMKKYKNFIKDD